MDKDMNSSDPNQQEFLLGCGADITGREVEFWGRVWTVAGRNDYGDWDVVRYEQREAGRVKVTTQIAPELLPESHPKFARLLPVN